MGQNLLKKLHLEPQSLRRMLVCAVNGFSAGLPLYYFYQFVPAWMRDEGASLQAISLVTGLGIFWSFKFLIAPLCDRYRLSPLGRRRSWMLIAQMGCIAGMLGCASLDPTGDIRFIAAAVTLVTLWSAIQDIALDAYRRELLPDNELGLGNSFYANAYRVAGFVPGGLGLVLADHISWSQTHMVMALFMGIGVLHSLLIKEITQGVKVPGSLLAAIVEPFRDFFGHKHGQARGAFGGALGVLFFIMLYKLGDNMATALQTPFFLDMGFTKTHIGSIVKLVSVASVLSGGFVGGLMMLRLGINKSLWVFGFVQMLTILGFAWLSTVPQLWVLGVVVMGEYFAAGLGSAALLAFMARSTNKNFTATQMALLTSIMALPRNAASMSTGFLVDGWDWSKLAPESFWQAFSWIGNFGGLGWTRFFILCFFMALPGMLLLSVVAPWKKITD